MQELAVILLFICAISYLVYFLFEGIFTKKDGCNKGCSACSTLDFKQLEKKILEDIKNTGDKHN